MFHVTDTKFPQILSKACKTVVDIIPGRALGPPKRYPPHTHTLALRAAPDLTHRSGGLNTVQAADRPYLGSGPGILAQGKTYAGWTCSKPVAASTRSPCPVPPCVCINTSRSHHRVGRLTDHQSPGPTHIGGGFIHSKPLWNLVPCLGLSRAEY